MVALRMKEAQASDLDLSSVAPETLSYRVAGDPVAPLDGEVARLVSAGAATASSGGERGHLRRLDLAGGGSWNRQTLDVTMGEGRPAMNNTGELTTSVGQDVDRERLLQQQGGEVTEPHIVPEILVPTALVVGAGIYLLRRLREGVRTGGKGGTDEGTETQAAPATATPGGENTAAVKVGRPMTRRKLLTLLGLSVVATLAGAGVERFFRWTEPGEAEGSHFDFSLLEEEVYPVAVAEAVSIVKQEIRKDLNPNRCAVEVVAVAGNDLVAGITNIGKLRNCAIFHPVVAEDIALVLSAYNCDPFQGLPEAGEGFPSEWTPQLLRANHLNVLKYEAYLALRNLVSRGLIPAAQLDGFHFNGCLSYLYGRDRDATIHEPIAFRKETPRDVRRGFKFYDTQFIKDTTDYTDKVVQGHWGDIKAAAAYFGVDPPFIASLISMEARDEKLYPLYAVHRNDTALFARLSQPTSLATMIKSEGVGDMGANKILQILYFIEDNGAVFRRIIPAAVSEEVTDFIGGILGTDASVGVGQVNIATAKRFGLLKTLGGRHFNQKAPDALYTLLLENPALNIWAVTGYVRKQIDEYTRLQRSGLNLYLPDLSRYNPSKERAGNKLTGDPLYGEDFGIAMFGACYTAKEYPEYGHGGDPALTRQRLRFVPYINEWGDWVAGYNQYYIENGQRLGLT